MADDIYDDMIELTEEGARMAAKCEGGLLLRPALGHITENGFEWYSESQQANILREYEGARMAERAAILAYLREIAAYWEADDIEHGEHLGEAT
jgi:hypothetical protein